MEKPLVTRRDLLGGALSTAVVACAQSVARPVDAADARAVYAECARRKDEAVQRLQAWVRQPSIAAENRGMNEGCEMMMQLAREAGFQRVEKVPTDGQPGVFATLDAGAPHTVGLYFMYDVKQADPKEWSSPPFDAALVDRPSLGKVVMGRGAVNQKGPQATMLAALHAFRGAGRKLPVNLVLVAEGEEEIGSPHFAQIARKPDVQAALARCRGIFMPSAGQEEDGAVDVSLGAKGIIECELTSSGERWGRGPKHDVHSSLRACVDSPAWHLVLALATLVGPDGDPAIDGFMDRVRPLSPPEQAMLDDKARRSSEALLKEQIAVDRWAHDVTYRQALEALNARPTVNIEGLVGGYTGPGGKTILPHVARAKLDLRLVPDMTAEDTLAKLKAHLAKRGFGDIDVNMTGGYDPNTTSVDAPLIRAQIAVYKRAGLNPLMTPRRGGSWPGWVFTSPPLSLAAGHFGLGNGAHAHAPDEYYVIDSINPKVAGLVDAMRAYVDYLYELA